MKKSVFIGIVTVELTVITAAVVYGCLLNAKNKLPVIEYDLETDGSSDSDIGDNGGESANAASEGTSGTDSQNDLEWEVVEPDRMLSFTTWEEMLPQYRESIMGEPDHDVALMALDRYDELLHSEDFCENMGMGAYKPELYVRLDFVDADNIPELFISRGTFFDDAVRVMTFDRVKMSEVDLGEFSSKGSLVFSRKGNRMMSEYPSNGRMLKMISEIDHGVTKLVNAYFRDGKKYYGGFPVHEGIDGTRVYYSSSFSNVFDLPGDQYSMDADMFEDKMKKDMGDTEQVEVGMDFRDPVKTSMLVLSEGPYRERCYRNKDKDPDDEEKAPEDVRDILKDHPEILEAYRTKYIKEKTEDSLINGYYLLDVNGSGIPELLIYDGDCHSSQVHVYTYHNGELIKLGQYGENSHMYVNLDSHVVQDGFYQGGSGEEKYFKLTEDREIFLGETTFREISKDYVYYDEYPDMQYPIDDEYMMQYSVDDKMVTYEEYSRKEREFIGEGSLVRYGYENAQMTGLED
ncbi:MAG: hypothetical protein IJM23_10685 [Lachnospiraceae bacterium]|nr:hypothetical protein [Lachnospiraceae bacterium]